MPKFSSRSVRAFAPGSAEPARVGGSADTITNTPLSEVAVDGIAGTAAARTPHGRSRAAVTRQPCNFDIVQENPSQCWIVSVMRLENKTQRALRALSAMAMAIGLAVSTVPSAYADDDTDTKFLLSLKHTNVALNLDDADLV